MYQIYHTESIVLDGRESGEASRYLFLFTRDLGLVGARAQGLRELKSKLRYSLQDFSHARVDLVRGKNGWRTTNAEHIFHYGSLLRDTKRREHFYLIPKVALLLRRLLKGEERNEKLFEEVMQSFSLLRERVLSREQLLHLEILTVMRILHHLGYWGSNRVPDNFIKSDITNASMLDEVARIKPLAIREINKSLQETQL